MVTGTLRRESSAILAWASLFVLLCAVLPITCLNELRQGHWNTLWFGAMAATLVFIRRELWPPVVAGLICLLAGPHLLGWYGIRQIWLWCLLATLFAATEDNRPVLWGIRVLTLLHIVLGWLQVIGADPILQHSGRPIGLMDSTFTLANWFIITAPLLMVGRWWIAFVAMVGLLLPLSSLGAVIGVAITAIASIVHKVNKKVLLGAIAVAMVTLTLYSAKEPVIPRVMALRSERIQMWQMVIEKGNDAKQFLGHGLNSYWIDSREWPKVRTVSFDWLPWSLAHNDAVQCWYEGGWLLVLAWGAVMASLLLKFQSIPPMIFAGLIGYFYCSMYAFPWHIAGLWLLGAAYVGMSLTKEKP